MSYIGAQTAPQATQLADNVVNTNNIVAGAVETTDLADAAVTSAKMASGAAVSNIGYTPVSTGKSIAMSIVFGG